MPPEPAEPSPQTVSLISRGVAAVIEGWAIPGIVWNAFGRSLSVPVNCPDGVVSVVVCLERVYGPRIAATSRLDLGV